MRVMKSQKEWKIQSPMTSHEFPCGLRVFALIVYVHPYCAHNSCCNIMPHHALSRCFKGTLTQGFFCFSAKITHIGEAL